MSQSENEEDNYADFAEMNILETKESKKTKLKLGKEDEITVSKIVSKAIMNPELNRHIDPKNQAKRLYLNLTIEELQEFRHFMVKNKNLQQRKDIFNVMRDKMNSFYKGKLNFDEKVKDKSSMKQIMVVRFVSKSENNPGQMEIEDQTGREKILIKQGVVWVGMICCIEAMFVDNMYRLERIIPFCPDEQPKVELKLSNSVYRLLLVKGSFWKLDQNQNIGLRLLISGLIQLRNYYKQTIRALVIMGPILSVKNEYVSKGKLERTYEDQFIELVNTIKKEVRNVYPEIEIIFVPSTDDVTNLYPIPQPKYQNVAALEVQGLKFTSNPGFIFLQGNKRTYKIDLINSDLIRYIDETKVGRSSIMNMLQQNFETYLKTPFILTNTIEEPFDEVNLPNLYNQGLFGDIIVTSSQYSPPYSQTAKDKVLVNIGSLGIDYHSTGKHYMTLVSIYDGEGLVSDRVKVQTLIM